MSTLRISFYFAFSFSLTYWNSFVVTLTFQPAHPCAFLQFPLPGSQDARWGRGGEGVFFLPCARIIITLIATVSELSVLYWHLNGWRGGHGGCLHYLCSPPPPPSPPPTLIVDIWEAWYRMAQFSQNPMCVHCKKKANYQLFVDNAFCERSMYFVCKL
jgi:hypothetical protein